MSRMIDADALPDALFQKHVHYGEGTEMYLSYNDVVDAIDAAPTVEAIPAEWLNNKMLDLQNRDKALSKAAWLVLYEWQKEQEAR